MSAAPINQETLAPDEEEQQLYARLAHLFDTQTARLVGQDGTEMPLPQRFSRMIGTLAHLLEANKVVTITASDRDLTTQQAADFLGVSRPYLVRLLEEEHALPFTRVGTHRRVRFEDVLAYREARYARQKQSMRELTQLGEELGGYDAPPSSPTSPRA